MQEHHAACPVCANTGSRSLPAYAAHHLVRCVNCRFVFASWIPTAEELGGYYANYPVRDVLSPVTAKRYDELLERFEPYRKTGRILDIGCGAGLFLERAALHGWEVHGTEFGALAVEACKARGIDIIQGPLDPTNYAAGMFDVVCSFEVIEHLTDPLQEFERMRTVLRPGGLMYITTPNFNCVGRWMAKGSWNVVNYPEHLSYFTARTLQRAALSQGLEKRWLNTTGFSVGRWRSSRVEDPEKKKIARGSDEVLRQRIEGDRVLRSVKFVVNALLDLFKIGDSMKGAWRKPIQ